MRQQILLERYEAEMQPWKWQVCLNLIEMMLPIVMQEDFQIMPMSTTVAQGATAVLKCLPPKANPEQTTTWIKNLEHLVPSQSG